MNVKLLNKISENPVQKCIKTETFYDSVECILRIQSWFNIQNSMKSTTFKKYSVKL